MKVFKKLSLFILVFFVSLLKTAVAEEELSFIYSGASYGALYKDDRLHASKLGGLESRAKVLAQEIKKDKDLIVLDTGNNCAGAVADPDRGDLQLDKQRTESFWEALFLMDYDAMSLGSDDLASVKILEELAVKKNKSFVSANAKSKVVQPYLRLQKGNKTMFFTALTARSKYMQTLDPSKALKKALKNAKANKELIVLSSALPYKESIKLLDEFPQVDILLLDKPVFPFFEHKKVKNTIVLCPFLLGKKIAKLDVSFEKGELLNYNFESIAIKDNDMRADHKLSEVIPACFDADHCAKKSGMTARCLNPGKQSECLYAELGAPKLKIISIEDCKACDNSFVLNRLEAKFPNLEISTMDYKSAEAKEYINKYEISTLPAFLFDKTISAYDAFEEGKDYFLELQDRYLMHPIYSGIFYFLDRTLEKGKLDVFVDLDSQDSLGLLQAIKPYQKERKLALYFLVKAKDIVLQEELTRILVIQELYPQKLLEYLIARFEGDIRSSYWSDIFKKLRINESKIVKLARSDDAETLLKKNRILMDELNVGRGGVLLIDNRKIFAVSNTSGADLEDYIN